MMLDIWPYNFTKGDYQKRYDFYLKNSDLNFEKLTPELRPKMKNFDAIYGKIQKFKQDYSMAHKRRQ